jgi:DNA-binding NarL/FixJ family response regulator
MRGTRERTAVVFDRQPLWLQAIGDLLEDVGVEVVGASVDDNDAVTLVEEHRPDIFVAGVDSSAEDTTGSDYVRRACEVDPSLRAIVVSERRDPEAVEAAFEAGAAVYCVRTAEREDLASAIRQAFEHSVYVAMTPRRQAAPRPAKASDAKAHDLTKRELEILRLVSEGHSNTQLARMLWVTEQTVKFHLSNIYRKLEVANRTEASRWAQLNGLLEPAAEAAA